MVTPRRRAPGFEGLETRQLPSALFAGSSSQSVYYREQQVWHKYHQYVSDLQHLELKSQATPAEYLALRDDARAISRAASGTSLTPAESQAKAVDVSLILDRAPLDGSLGDGGWAEIAARLAADLDGLNVPPALVDQTVTDMRAVARDAHVSSDDYQAFTAKADSYADGRSAILHYETNANFPDPILYYTQHLRGFFRGGAVQRDRDEATLRADLRAIEAGDRDTPTSSAVLSRDVRALEQVGAVLSTDSNTAFGDAFVAVFSQGAPGAQDITQLRGEFAAILDGSVTPSASSAADRLVSDAGAFFQAAGSSADNVRTIVTDVRAAVADGVGGPLNPFKVQIG